VQTEKRELAVLVRGKIRPGGKDEWHNELYVPPLPPTNLHGCHLIKISYDVFFVIEPKSMEKEIKLQLPIVLATYPFRHSCGCRAAWPCTQPSLGPRQTGFASLARLDATHINMQTNAVHTNVRAVAVRGTWPQT